MPPTNVAPQPAQRTTQRAATAAPSRFALAQVIGRTVTARNTVTFWLAAPGTTRAPAPYRPGQFVTLALPGEGQRVIYRSYSLCGDGRPDQPWEIAVKRRPGGGGSGYLHDRVTLGMTLPVSAPGGSFTLPQALSSNASLIFVAAGSGITPIYGMLRALAALPPQRRPHVQLHYAYRGAPDALYGDAIDALDPQGTWLRQWRYLSTAGQRMGAAEVIEIAGAQAPNADWYLCGPTELMRAVESAARQVGAAPERIHTERFYSPPTPARRATAAGAVVARVHVAQTGATLQSQAGETLLETLERHGYEADFSCRAGSCGTCRLRVVGGRVRNPDGQALTPAERKAGYVESCVAQPLGDVTIALDGVAAPRPAARRAAGKRRAVVAVAASRASARRKARWTLAVASIALFGVVWNLTDHKITTASATSSSSSGSGASNSVSSGGSDDGSNANSSSSSNGSIFNPQPSQNSSSSSTGVS